MVAQMSREALEELGSHVARLSDASADSARVVRGARGRIQESLDRRRSRRTGWLAPRVLWTAAALASICGSAAVYWLGSEPAPLTAHVESRSIDPLGDWVSTGTETKQLRFSDGTTVSLHPETRLQVQSTSATGASVVLDRGRALASVEHTGAADWQFWAGPFHVRVTGTEFDLAWDPGKGVFELALHQGEVLLEGPTVDGVRPIRKGDYVKIEVPASPANEALHGAEERERGDASVRRPSLDGRHGGDATDPRTDVQAAETRPAEALDETQRATGAENGTNRNVDRWQDLLAAGRRADALRAVDRVGSARAIATANAKELWALANAARLGGRPELARSSLEVLRSKHGQRGQSAFVLGKVAADQLRARSEAITWFETYLMEAPNGPFAEQALGRLVELQAGSPRGKRAAEEYLARYPDGAYASFARSSLR